MGANSARLIEGLISLLGATSGGVQPEKNAEYNPDDTKRLLANQALTTGAGGDKYDQLGNKIPANIQSSWDANTKNMLGGAQNPYRPLSTYQALFHPDTAAYVNQQNNLGYNEQIANQARQSVGAQNFTTAMGGYGNDLRNVTPQQGALLVPSPTAQGLTSANIAQHEQNQNVPALSAYATSKQLEAQGQLGSNAFIKAQHDSQFGAPFYAARAGVLQDQYAGNRAASQMRLMPWQETAEGLATGNEINRQTSVVPKQIGQQSYDLDTDKQINPFRRLAAQEQAIGQAYNDRFMPEPMSPVGTQINVNPSDLSASTATPGSSYPHWVSPEAARYQSMLNGGFGTSGQQPQTGIARTSNGQALPPLPANFGNTVRVLPATQGQSTPSMKRDVRSSSEETKDKAPTPIPVHSIGPLGNMYDKDGNEVGKKGSDLKSLNGYPGYQYDENSQVYYQGQPVKLSSGSGIKDAIGKQMTDELDDKFHQQNFQNNVRPVVSRNTLSFQ